MACPVEPAPDPDEAVEGVVFNIQRYSIQDGPGIRTTVFLKGCPLQCEWCSNPESQKPHPEIMFRSQQCQKWGGCADVCDVRAITLIDGTPSLERATCTLCMDCIEACPSGALEVSGRRMTLDAVVEESCKDELFYTNSGGGVTLSGGEPLAQPEFSRLLLKACADRSIHTALDTSGHATWPIMKSVLEYTDLLLFDLKHLSPEEHLAGTGATNDLILENLRKTLDSKMARVWIRIPVIPGYNDDDPYLKKLALALAEMRPEKVSLLGYHEWGRSKYGALGREYPCNGIVALPKARLDSIKRTLEAAGIEVTIDH
jgi:pyruvate formate lyase activating enzyme